MKILILKVTEDCVFIGCEENYLLNNRKAIFVRQVVYDYVSKFLDPRREFFEKKLNECPTSATCIYWEENWHDKLVNDIIMETGFNKGEISNAISAYFGY